MESDNSMEAVRVVGARVGAAELDHDMWNGASPVHLTRYWSGEEAPFSRQAEARIIWSEAALSVRFVCRQGEPLVINPSPQLEQKTIGLWDRDVCEIFIAPEARNRERYLEFEAAPTGEWLDLSIEHKGGVRETDWEFNSGMSVEARIHEGLITIAISVPWTAFGRSPTEGERWRANLFRCVGAGPSRGYLAWQPTRSAQPDFHVPVAFGWIIFA